MTAAVAKSRLAKGLCPVCGRPKSTEGYRCSSCSENAKGYYRTHVLRHADTLRVKWKEEARAVRREVIAHLGGKCVCCGETEFTFLCVDHVNNDGNAHRRVIGNEICSWLKRNCYPPGFQILCRNCNYGKHLNGGVCPHQRRLQNTPVH